MDDEPAVSTILCVAVVGSAFLPLLLSIVDAELVIVDGFSIGVGEVAMYWDATAAAATTGVPLRNATDEVRVGAGVVASSANTGLLSMGDNDCTSGGGGSS